MTRLSICIPTYNFGDFIGATLDTIVPQLVDGVEVVILDGGSTDQTPDVVAAYRARHPAIRYERRPERGGIDRDLARTVELARGEHCWLFCSDDLMRPGAVASVLEDIGSGHDLYVCGFTLCAPDMRPLFDAPIMHLVADAEFDLADPRDRLAYFAAARTTPAFFSFAGSLIFKKAVWEREGLNEDFVGSCWAHVARFFALMPQGLTLKWLARSHVDKRTENDSFMDRGVIRRYALAIDGYNRLAATYFGDDSPEARHIRRAVRNEFPPWILLHAKLESEGNGYREDLPLLDRLAETVYRDRSATNRLYSFVYRATPIGAYRAALAGYRRAKMLARRGVASVP